MRNRSTAATRVFQKTSINAAEWVETQLNRLNAISWQLIANLRGMAANQLPEI